MTKIKYTDEGLLPWQGAICKTPIFPPILNLFGIGTCTITIKPKYIEDKGILNHELKHVEQFKTKLFHILRYKYSRKYRLDCELEAYTEQIKTYSYKNITQCSWIIDALVNKYDLKVTVAFIIKQIESILKEVNEK